LFWTRGKADQIGYTLTFDYDALNREWERSRVKIGEWYGQTGQTWKLFTFLGLVAVCVVTSFFMVVAMAEGWRARKWLGHRFNLIVRRDPRLAQHRTEVSALQWAAGMDSLDAGGLKHRVYLNCHSQSLSQLWLGWFLR
jgi:hypothetical protein